MLENIEPQAILDRSMAWLQGNVLTMDVFIQGSLVLGTLFLATIIYRVATTKISAVIDKMGVSSRIKHIMRNLTKLLFPLSALILLCLVQLVNAVGVIDADWPLVQAVISLLMAWIAIRLLVQFIENSFVRNAIAFTVWTIAALSILGFLDETTTALDTLGMDMGEVRISVLSVIKGLFALFILLYAATFTASLLERRIRKISGLTISSKVLIGKVIRITLVTFALLIGITSAGIDLSLLAVFSGAIGLGIGFGLQKGISNLFSGMLLLMDKSIKPGDILELPGGTFGWIEHMGARYTSIVTRDNKSFLIPNEDFITQQVVNWSHGNTLVRIEVEFGVDYRHNPHEIKKMSEEAAITPERICNDPAPICHFVEFGESSLNFKLRFWIKDAEKGVTNTRAAVMMALWDTFQVHGVKIPYPHREVYIREEGRDRVA